MHVTGEGNIPTDVFSRIQIIDIPVAISLLKLKTTQVDIELKRLFEISSSLKLVTAKSG